MLKKLKVVKELHSRSKFPITQRIGNYIRAIFS
jgi:hypothetical protein